MVINKERGRVFNPPPGHTRAKNQANYKADERSTKGTSLFMYKKQGWPILPYKPVYREDFGLKRLVSKLP